jgi:4-amino-4-deoxy-L-arabinose transferase-like glycosyltransferase
MANTTAQQSAPPSRNWRTLAIALVLFLSAWVQINVVTRTNVDSPVRGDARHYVSYAWNLYEHHVFSRAQTWVTGDSRSPMPDKMTLPGYPAFLATMLDGAPDMRFIRRVVFAQAALGVLTCVFVLMAALRLLPFGLAIATGLLAAISPHFASISTYLLTEALFTTLVAASTYLLIRVAEDNPFVRWYALAGLVIGLASLVRPQLEMVPFILVTVCLCVRSLRPRWRAAFLGLVCFVAVTAPWQIRNATTESPTGEPNLLATTLYHGSFPDMMYKGNPESYGFPYRFDPEQATHNRDVSAALAYIAEGFEQHPAQMVRWYLLGKPEFFLSWGIVAGMGDVFIFPVTSSPYLQSPLFKAMHAIAYWLHWPLTIAALVALGLSALRPKALAAAGSTRRALRLLALVFTVVVLMHMIGLPLPRYGIPFRTLVFLLGMTAVHVAWVRLVKKGSAAPARDLKRHFPK